MEEKRYRKLLLGMDLTQDFFFSYTYDVASTLQNNLTASAQQDRFDSMFVWNDHLTRCHPAITIMPWSAELVPLQAEHHGALSSPR
jgi:SacI homology domain